MKSVLPRDSWKWAERPDHGREARAAPRGISAQSTERHILAPWPGGDVGAHQPRAIHDLYLADARHAVHGEQAIDLDGGAGPLRAPRAAPPARWSRPTPCSQRARSRNPCAVRWPAWPEGSCRSRCTTAPATILGFWRWMNSQRAHTQPFAVVAVGNPLLEVIRRIPRQARPFGQRRWACSSPPVLTPLVRGPQRRAASCLPSIPGRRRPRSRHRRTFPRRRPRPAPPRYRRRPPPTEAFGAGLLGDSARQGHGAVVERLDLEGAERAVPHQGRALGDLLDIDRDRLRPDIEDHLVVGAGLGIDHLARRTGLELTRDHDVDRQQDLAVGRLGLGHDLARGVGEVLLGQRLADLDPLRQPGRCWPCRRR